jgi:endonuclease/exonuclease/phosphatase family metal-dependent hydrolase
MVELVTADRPTIVCLQEVPAWALDRVGEWAGMQAVSVRTKRSKVGLFPIPRGFGRRLTSIHAGRSRSAFQGQGNVILLPEDAKIRQAKQITLNTNPFCEEQAAKLGISAKEARRWESERRVCHLAKIEFLDRNRMLVANVHATSWPTDLRLPDAELRRAASFVDRAAEIEETVIFAGDFNTTLERSETLRDLTTRLDERYSATGPYIDHILVRNAAPLAPTAIRVWPDDERALGEKLLSDHAPVELRLVEPPKKPPPPPPTPAPAPPPVVDEPPATPTVKEPKEDDRWETPKGWETPGDRRWEEP